MHYVKDIFEKKNSQHAHDKLIRYSKGDFLGPLINIKFQSSAVKLAASFHFVDELLFLVAEVLKDKQVHVTGSIVWNTDLGDKFLEMGIKYSKVTKARGIFKYVLDNDVNFKQFVDLMSSYNLLLTFKHEGVTFSTKSSVPKPNKDFGPDFCKVTLPVEMKQRVKEEFLFDVKEDVKDAKIRHRIVVTDIQLPKDAENFEEARRLAVRKGTFDRTVEVAGEVSSSKVEFSL